MNYTATQKALAVKQTRIDKLSPDQIARFAEWTEEWVKIGLSTEPANFDKATAAALRGYELANLKKPMIVLRMSSPYGATLGGALAWAMLRVLKGEKVRSQVESQVESQVWSQVWSQVGSQVWSQVGKELREAPANLYHGATWASYAAYVSFLRDVCGWDNQVLERFEIDETLIKNCGWVWWHENVLAISDRPLFIKRDGEGRMHSETGPAIEYRDGWALHYWHGTAIPAEWVEQKQKLTAKIAITWENIEQRRCACEILGWASILTELKAKTIDKDGDPEIGELVEVTIPDVGKERFLRVQCGTGRGFALPVPPNMKTALEAQAWTWALDTKSFVKPEIRT